MLCPPTPPHTHTHTHQDFGGGAPSRCSSCSGPRRSASPGRAAGRSSRRTDGRCSCGTARWRPCRTGHLTCGRATTGQSPWETSSQPCLHGCCSRVTCVSDEQKETFTLEFHFLSASEISAAPVGVLELIFRVKMGEDISHSSPQSLPHAWYGN